MDFKINSYNSSFGAKMITEGFGIRSSDAKRWKNIAELFEIKTIMYPNDVLNISRQHLAYVFKAGKKQYGGNLGWHKSDSYKEVMKYSDDTIAEKFAKMNEIFRQSQSIVENSKKHLKEIVNLFEYNYDRNYVADRLLDAMDTLSKVHIDSSFDSDNILKKFTCQNVEKI